MATSPLLYAVIAFAVIAAVLLLIQILIGFKSKKSSGYSGNNGKGNAPKEKYYQIIPAGDTSRRLTDAIGTIDENIPYSFNLDSPNNNVIHTFKISGKSNDINTWWQLVRDPNGTQAYRFKSLITGNYVSFQKEETYDRYGVRLFRYINVEDPVLGDPSVDGTGWFYFIKTNPLKSAFGYRYRIRCVEPKDFYLTTPLNWEGRNFESYEHYWYDDPDTIEVEPGKNPVQPRAVYIEKFANDNFYLQKNIKLAKVLADVY